MTDTKQPDFSEDNARWQAVLDRDRRADGGFWCGVVTTGIYCRPQCAARPKRENVRFFTSREAARAAGLRACKRCRPDDDGYAGSGAPPRTRPYALHENHGVCSAWRDICFLFPGMQLRADVVPHHQRDRLLQAFSACRGRGWRRG